MDLSRIQNKWIDPACREEHDGVKIIPVAKVVEKLFMKETFPQNVIFIFGDLLYLQYWGLTANLRVQIDSGDPGLSFGYI